MLDSVVGGQQVQTTYGHMLYGSRQVQAGRMKQAEADRRIALMEAIVKRLTKNKANQLLVDAMLDRDLLKALISDGQKISGRTRVQHERAIRGWLAGTGARLLEEED
jgi:predicted Mrr-cat superfamily restriction endonuclease